MKHAKTLFEDQLDDQFLKLMDSKRIQDFPEKSLEATFVIYSPQTPVKYPSYFFQLHEHIMVCRKDPSKEPIAYMDILNALMRKTSETEIEGKLYYGIRFIKKGAYEELLSPDEEVVNTWFEALKKVCLMTKFRQYFDSKKVLGKGNFAKVFLVTRKSNGEDLAVKAFSKAAIMGDSLEIKCLQYEIKMMRAVNHERIMRIQEVYEGENFVYCVLELYKGQDLLNAIIKKGPQPELKALTLTLQLLQGLEYLHSKKIIHRDLKPENILFKHANDSMDLGIVDLGFATYESDYKKLFVRCGTPGYVAPEVLNDLPYGCKADIFSLGVILFMILTGNMPFQGNSYKEIVRKNMKGEVNFDFTEFKVKVSHESQLISNGPAQTTARKGPFKKTHGYSSYGPRCIPLPPFEVASVGQAF